MNTTGQYLENNPGNLHTRRREARLKSLRPGQEVLTFVANGDPIGNFRWDNDLDQRRGHVFLPVRESERIPYIRANHYTDLDKIFKSARGFRKYHGITHMFDFLKYYSSYNAYRRIHIAR